MSYKCKRCGKTSNSRSGLKCYRCDTQEASALGIETTMYSSPPIGSDISVISSGDSWSGSGGDYGGGGASGSWD